MTPTSVDARYQFFVHTYGCKVNTYDTGLLQKRLERAGQVFAPEMAKQAKTGIESKALSPLPRVHILNTCAVTAEATREAVRGVRRLKAVDPLATVVVTGCSAQVDGQAFDTLPGVDLVIANSHKQNLEAILDSYFKGTLEDRVLRSNIFRKDELEAGGGVEEGHTRAFLKVQDGCNSFCTFCVIPYARGKSRSIPIRDLVARVRELHARGILEIVLTGVHIGDYEDRAGPVPRDLTDLAEAVLSETDMPRIRLTSLEPIELSERLIGLFAQSERLCRHFHMSIQSANTRVLHAMKRKYGAADVEGALRLIAERVPGAFVGMDVIAGFPGESRDEFEDTYLRLADLPWTRLHVFPYSERPGTKATLLPDSVAREDRVLRSARLRELSARKYQNSARAQVGLTKRALILEKPARGAEGLSRDYWPVAFNGDLERERASRFKGREVSVRVTGYQSPENGRMDGVLAVRFEESM